MEQSHAPGRSLLRFLAEPSHVNFGGKVHGGMLMKWLDQAGYTCAAQWSGNYCVTVYIGGIHFTHPILVGSIVELRCQVIHTGRTSMHIGIDIFAGDPRERNFKRKAYCVAVFVAMGEEGRPVPVPAWEPHTEHERALERYALRMIEHRKQMEEEAQLVNDAAAQ
jgi:acyl-CoA hydrolase